MTETTIAAERDAAKSRRRHRRVKRGVVASYIHEISERRGSRAKRRVAPAFAPPPRVAT